jgi:putative tryptophan/tyrosine transport system substrate-binding protein
MTRREFITLAGGAAATWPLAARAQADHVRRIGVLMGLDANDQVGQSEVRALKQGLQELGWMEGRNLQIEYGWAGGEPGRIQASAKELVGLKCRLSNLRTHDCRQVAADTLGGRAFLATGRIHL